MADETALLTRAMALQAEAARVLDDAALDAAFSGFGRMELVGSAVSGLMVWRDLDVMFTAPDASAAQVLAALARLAAGGRLLAADFRDERGPRRPTAATSDERFYVVCGYDWPAGKWKIDITVWLHAVDRSMRRDAERLATHLGREDRLAILQIKDVWHHKPTYPDQVGGLDVYTAVLDDGVRTPQEFAVWLKARGLPQHPGRPMTHL
jgi:hypothetical protein